MLYRITQDLFESRVQNNFIPEDVFLMKMLPPRKKINEGLIVEWQKWSLFIAPLPGWKIAFNHLQWF